MENGLRKAIDDGDLKGNQVLLPTTVSKRLTEDKLPTINLTDDNFLSDVMTQRFKFHCPSGNAAGKLLTTAMRDAGNAGRVLKEAYRRVGWYLATQYLTDVIGLEEYKIPLVQKGEMTDGHRFKNGNKTIMVPLMRVSESMAFGVSDAFPEAMFFHAKDSKKLKKGNVSTIVLVDGVTNTGASIVEFVEHIRNLDADVRDIVIAGVVQADAVSKSSRSIGALDRGGELSLIALRTSAKS